MHTFVKVLVEQDQNGIGLLWPQHAFVLVISVFVCVDRACFVCEDDGGLLGLTFSTIVSQHTHFADLAIAKICKAVFAFSS